MIRALAFTLALLPSFLPDVGNAQQTTTTDTANMRALDKVSGQAWDFSISTGQSARVGTLTVFSKECRYPTDDPSSNAYVFLSIQDERGGGELFRGWMIASSPALNAFDHARYDVWVLSCALAEKPEE